MINKVLEVKQIDKTFRTYSTEFKRILSWFGFDFKPKEEHKILKNINFSIGAGEAVGIVGQNGAGKSTLLKIITGTLKPSKGTVYVDGRISAILELGMGFHPDLTGRENVYHSAGLMGFTIDQIDSVIDELEDFAEIGEYFDQPVRTYSSGMQMRVAFGVVTAYKPEILIVDEALSVGDAYFQHKSLARVKEFQKQGTTLLLVSHDRGAIQAICSRAILLEKGSVIKDGDPEEVMDFYNALIAEKENSTIKQVVKEDGKVKTTSGTREVEFIDVKLFNSKDKESEVVGVGEAIRIQLTVKVNKNVNSMVLGCGIKDRLGQMIFGTNTFHTKQIVKAPKQDDIYTYDVSFDANLGIGSYSVHASLVEEKDHIHKNFNWVDGALVFNVVNFDKEEFVGLAWNKMNFRIKKVN